MDDFKKLKEIDPETPKKERLKFKQYLKSTVDYVWNFREEENRNALWWITLTCLSLIGIASRLHYITKPNNIVWDEAHFGKFGSWYLNRTFFFDVHPPGGKLLIALFGYISGYNGTYTFKEPGLSYEGYDEIMYMRVCCALLGAGMVPLSFSIVWTLTNSLTAAVFSALLCIYEIGTIALSKFILLDPLLMFFMMATFHGFVLFARSTNDKPWTPQWWSALLYTGLSLGCVMSVKFVGVFIVAFVGLYTAADLWCLYSDINMSMLDMSKHLLARVVGLILLPLSVYVGIFFIHDQVLFAAVKMHPLYGDLGVGGFSSEFQMRLVNSSLYNLTQPAEVTYGSIVTLRNDYLGGGYLHSHNMTYPLKYVPSKLQQVTTLRAKDENNLFRVLFPLDDPENENGFYGGDPEPLLHQSWLRLHHLHSNATVASHSNKSLIAQRLNLIYGRKYTLIDPEIVLNAPENEEETHMANIEFPFDIWKVHIENGKDNETVKPLKTRFQLVSAKFGCALTWSKEKYPNKWGFGQGEVACTKNFRDPYTFWKIEETHNPYDNNTTIYNSTITFWERFVETHQTMTWVNARLKPDTSNEDGHFSWHWPILYKAQPWYDTGFRIVLMGNPLIFYLNLVTLLCAPIFLIWREFHQCRRPSSSDKDDVTTERFVFAVRWLLIAYLLHYVPFMFMNRILYFHHYFPALQFSSMMTAVMMTSFFEKVAKYFRTSLASIVFYLLVLVMVILLTLSFLLYCYVAYGVDTIGAFNPNNSTFRHLRFVDRWEI